MKKVLILSLVLIFAISGIAIAAGTWEDCTYKSVLGEQDISDKMINVDGSTYAPLRFLLEKFGFTVNWDGKNKIATFGANNYGNMESLKKASVRIYKVIEGEEIALGNGFFVRPSKIATNWEVMKRSRDLGPGKLKAYLWNDDDIDIINFRGNKNRLCAMVDTKGHENKFVVKLADKNAKKYSKTTLITSTETPGNELLVANQISDGEIKKINYEYSSNGVLYSLLNNDTDNRLNGDIGEQGEDGINLSIGGPVYNPYGELVGIFDKVEPGNNGNIFMTPVSYLKLFLEDELD
jgi:hypothetical protein